MSKPPPGISFKASWGSQATVSASGTNPNHACANKFDGTGLGFLHRGHGVVEGSNAALQSGFEQSFKTRLYDAGSRERAMSGGVGLGSCHDSVLLLDVLNERTLDECF